MVNTNPSGGVVVVELLKIVFTRKKAIVNFHYNIKGFLPNICTEILDLGVLMVSSLTFASHIAYITNKAFNTLGFIIRNTREFTNILAIKCLFCTLVRSRLKYCCLFWTPQQFLYINMIKKVLRKFAKYLHFSLYMKYSISHYDRKSTDEYSLLSRKLTSCLIFLQKLITGDICSPSTLSELRKSIPA
ncbi:hypothetical protein BDFB_004842 [Asbolus verrucosus]|uniref:Uncharacterized protein n=1 Tax=Asbolus verrucosus TaxID=1661398 RepID=A0A482WBW5_ASBVE|nr:hypothetical protein BDFB_004842 [Asbolus verrucosus]